MKLKKIATAIAATTLALPPHAHAARFSTCPSGHDGVIDGTPTSCAFADNVRFGQPGNPVLAYSPVTNACYSMTCVAHTTVNFKQ
ncbi:MAG: hypothetical protein JOZ49_11515 [Mycolicibacterium sp.]|nr:hypothetical protein [Mycolicibacterium sp.]